MLNRLPKACSKISTSTHTRRHFYLCMRADFADLQFSQKFDDTGGANGTNPHICYLSKFLTLL
jgi:hypothetical protein